MKLSLNPSEGDLRTFALTALIFALLVGTIFLLNNSNLGVVALIWGLGLLIFILEIVFPKSTHIIYVSLSVIAFPIGWVVSVLLLSVIYYFILTPIGLILKMGRLDLLNRRIDKEAESYWVARDTSFDIQRYFRQF